MFNSYVKFVLTFSSKKKTRVKFVLPIRVLSSFFIRALSSHNHKLVGYHQDFLKNDNSFFLKISINFYFESENLSL